MNKWFRQGMAGMAILGMGIWLAACQFPQVSNRAEEQEVCSKELFAMDTYMTFSAYGKEREKAVDEAIEEVERLDRLWSVSSKDGEIYQINEKKEGAISKDTVKVIRQAQNLYQDTEGVFDLTVYPLMDLWGFTTGNYRVPEKKERMALLKEVNQASLQVEDRYLRIDKNQKIDLGGIAKGYTSQKIMQMWKKIGVKSGMVSLGGNVQVLGKKPDQTLWHVGIRNPLDPDGEVMGVVETEDQAVITSGGYERYFKENKKSYCHIIDTQTGAPAESDVLSVTIVSKDGTLADGLSTSLFIMGKEKAITFWRRKKDQFDMILVGTDGGLYASEGLQGSFTSSQKIQWITFR